MKSYISKILYIFSPFKFRNYTYLWTGAFISNIGSWVQTLALNWYIVNKLNLAVYLGMLNFISSLPVILFSLPAGVLADRFNKKNIIILTHILMSITALILGIVIHYVNTNIITWIFVIILIFGICNSFTTPAWQAILPQLVDRQYLLSAIALNSAQFNLARFIGPIVAGFIIATAGLIWCFYFNSISFLFVVLSLIFITVNSNTNNNNDKVTQYLVNDIKEAWQYILRNKSLLLYLFSAGVISFFGMGYVVLLPIYAKNILKGNVQTLGMLMSSSGLGAFSGALLVSLINLYVQKFYIIKFGIIFYSIVLSVFAISKNLTLSCVSVYFAAMLYIMTISSVNSSIQEKVEEEYRGRVMSNFVWFFMGMMPFGALVCGILADILSVATTLLIFNFCLFLWSTLVLTHKYV